MSQYRPHNESNKLAVLSEPATLLLDENMPRLDGATAFYPVYAAFAQAVYPPGDYFPTVSSVGENYVICSKTPEAYRRLVDGEADIIFVFAPDEEQAQHAQRSGVELEFTPIGTEAFVFFVNSQNPVNGVTADEMRRIYSGEITNWKELGGNDEQIMPYQRNEGSGSQTALTDFMGDVPLMKPKYTQNIDAMGFMVGAVDYQNHTPALGYSFRLYVTDFVEDNSVKLLEIDGIAPTRENIENGKYPLTYDFYAVTAAAESREQNPNVKPFIDWILSEQGQFLIEETGYTGIN
jgi:phosphate transport system substrate-binding protein